MTPPMTYLSFLVRLWHEPNTESSVQPTHWKGEVEHIQSGQRWTFETLDEVLSFLRQRVSNPQMSSYSADE